MRLGRADELAVVLLNFGGLGNLWGFCCQVDIMFVIDFYLSNKVVKL
jgi:hypothetical protein